MTVVFIQPGKDYPCTREKQVVNLDDALKQLSLGNFNNPAKKVLILQTDFVDKYNNNSMRLLAEVKLQSDRDFVPQDLTEHTKVSAGGYAAYIRKYVKESEDYGIPF